MKQKTISNKSVLLTDRPGVTVDNSLKTIYKKALNSPFIQRKVKQAETFIAKHGLPAMKQASEKEKVT